jgi:hypothetical protein
MLLRPVHGTFPTTNTITPSPPTVNKRLDPFGFPGERLVILLAGGTKKRQQDDIRHAQKLWTDYRRRSKKER